MSDEIQPAEESPLRELEREERRLIRLRRVVELHTQAEPADDTIGDFDPDPKEAA
jgi:hypothetical protein